VTPLAISLEDVRAAARTIQDAIVRTPSDQSYTLSAMTGADIRLKFEIFQFTASFKERGALNRLSALSAEERARGVIAMSAGNHAQGVAYHATRLGIPATIVMPRGTPFTKVKRTEELGAEVVLIGDSLDEARAEAERIRQERQLVFIHPYDDPLIMAGQGTVALEFLDQEPDIDTLVIPIGGGGLIAGCAVAAKALRPDIRILGVQSEAFPGMKAALAGQEIKPVRQTVAEGIAVKQPGKLTRDVVRRLVDDILIVSEDRIEEAIDLFMEIEKVVVEGAGAAGLAAVRQFPDLFEGRKVGLVACGGNIDPRTLVACVMRGLVRDGRMCRLRVATLDQPGALARVTTAVAEAGGNIIEVYHQRQFAATPVKYTEIELVIETKDRRHSERVIRALQDQGLEVSNTSKLEGFRT